MGSKCLNMKSGNSVLSVFLLVLLVSLLLPEADCWGVRGRALANRRTARKGPVRSSQGQRQRQRPPQRKPKRINRRRGSKSWEEAPPESDVAYKMPLLWKLQVLLGTWLGSVRSSCSTGGRAP